MSTDDDALSWAGDDERRSSGGPALPAGFDAVGRGSEAVGRIEADGTVSMPGAPRPTSNSLLVALGVIGGVYLLYALGWVIAGLRLASVSAALVAPLGAPAPPLWDAGAVMTLGLAAAAPPVWFVAALVLTRAARPWWRIAVLVLGAVLLVPWPFIAVGAIG